MRRSVLLVPANRILGSAAGAAGDREAMMAGIGNGAVSRRRRARFERLRASDFWFDPAAIERFSINFRSKERFLDDLWPDERSLVEASRSRCAALE
ncbi:MAG TPA: hypothetical protein VH165_01715 [Kofleriaceae bacterium]|nr:hypothetical protein [Kofleriaceae bacterium]